MKSKLRNDSIDVLKGITIILVVCAHSSLSDFFNNNYIKNFRMPLFFIMSGYLFFPYFHKAQKKIKVIFLKKYKNLIIPYLSFAIIGAILVILKRFFYDEKIELKKIISGIISSIGPTIQGNAPIWFLTCLFFSTIFLTFVLKYITFKFEAFTILSVYCIGFIGYKIGSNVWIIWNLDIAMVALIFLYIGYKVNEKKILINSKFSNRFTIISVFFVFLISNYFNDTEIDMNMRNYGKLIFFYISGISGSYLIYVLTDKFLIKIYIIKMLFKYIGKNSLVILGMHSLVISVVYSFLKLIKEHPEKIFLYNVISLILAILISLLFSHVFEKNKFSRKYFKGNFIK